MTSAAAEMCRRYTENLGLPHNLQAVCIAHLFTGILLLSGAFSQSATIGVLLLFVSFLGVFTLCRFAPPAVSDTTALSANLADVEKALPALSVASQDVSLQLAEKQRQCVEVAAPAVIFDRDEVPEVRPLGGTTTQEVSVDLAAPSAEKEADTIRERCFGAAGTPRQGPTLVEQACSPVAPSLGQDGVLIPDEATVIEGLRLLLVHHLRKSDIESLSEAQSELLGHHLVRLASYSQKIVYTISFAQRVLADARLAEQEQAQQPRTGPNEEQWAATASAVPAVENEPMSPPSEKPCRRLKLTDGELLKMYGMAQQEAALEADWRGFGDSAMKAASSSSAPFGSVEAVLEPPGVSKWRAGDALVEAPTHRTQERMAAIQLLGQALQARHGSSPRSPRDDLARRLLPVPSRNCDEDLIPRSFGSCCAVGSEEAAPSLGKLEHLGRVPVLRLGELSASHPQADSTALTAPPPVAPVLLEPEDEAKVVSETPEGNDNSQGVQSDWHDGLWQVP